MFYCRFSHQLHFFCYPCQVVISTIGLLFVKKLEEQPLWGLKGVLEVHFYGELFDLDHVFVTATALYYRLHFCTHLWLPWGSLLGIDKLCWDQELNLFFSFVVLNIQGQGCIFFLLFLTISLV
ncbi:rhomboid-like protein 19 [Dioscorea cayenensis subsp. rotundata]|uniref:Rhomboid-like protein 19 n=1 Tax=Dioscorea cayennensis subsp. rotundata TaxID=55577 RepID=A0AB40CD14_DIOCR|nr:rhomboid-like protein 19 [Dioscorea cayenensis subsp. rotundata]XP_039137646.1 rhomboid-like protein 19 [Dioscorea cayenensis subsp. rotundata]XP_039137647.1 rhomboid-like protein 19 [Dioscorea cayenensis subsp. rotundata]